MKQLFLLGAMVCALGMMTACKSGTISEDTTSSCADTTLECHPLFDSLEYNNNGIAFVKDVSIVINDVGRYDFFENDPIYAGKQGASAVAFDYCGEHYYIPLHETIHWEGAKFPDTARVTFEVWRDYNHHGRPFAIVYNMFLYHKTIDIE